MDNKATLVGVPAVLVIGALVAIKLSPDAKPPTSSPARHDVGRETNNPAPSSDMTLTAAQLRGRAWQLEDPVNHRWSTPNPSGSMVPYLDSHSVLLLEAIAGPLQIHDIIVLDEGPGRENVCHQVMDVRDGYVYLDGKNNLWPDGWFKVSLAKWRVASVIYSNGQ